ncbi:Receptor-like protein 34 [Camellia lanceoleosa]|uniref:Receptor-like protein 34 n=1 Tax=Camellia lanceoleosa TaxID=1840588 RepID=A0ACC0FU22_9ERIC|nr:Receptor-like protein 34 [Camellia lanceoleosa]
MGRSISNYQLKSLLFFLLFSLVLCLSSSQESQPLICNLRFLEHLDLSNNQFHGVIPSCLVNFSENLLVLNLQGNNFSGTIPQTFRQASKLRTLDVSNNKLHGELPRSLANCTNLEILNVGHNSIVDVFPYWLENLPQLKILVLKDNGFHGPIAEPRKRSVFTKLHIIDVSHNNFTGTLPSKYFEKWNSMMRADEDATQSRYMGDNGGYYFDSMTITYKGREMVFVRILTIFKAVDFSHNKFHGNIPTSIGRLKALIFLNFSGNGLSGFDVSQNNLTGLIPQGQQFATFSNTSYEGNPGLCGFPLSKKCGENKVVESPFLQSPKHELDDFGWEVVFMGYGFGVVLGLAIGSCMTQRKEEWIARIFSVKIHQQGKKTKKSAATGRKMTHSKPSTSW